MFFFIFFDISSLLLRYITPAIPRSSRLDLSKNILKNIDSYLNFRTLEFRNIRKDAMRTFSKRAQRPNGPQFVGDPKRFIRGANEPLTGRVLVLLFINS